MREEGATGPELRALMRRAIDLAERGGGATAPNPMVGCVIADREGTILGEGFHARAGGPHAEAVALEATRAAGRELAGATAVVTLEPCAHRGRTGPCADALREAGVERVVYAIEDPAAGRGGARRLREAGVDVVAGVEADAVRALLEPWLHFVETGRPFVHVKVAQTLSGHVTRGPGGATRITGPETRAAVHRIRRRHRALLVGSGTVLADDPRLTVRDWPPAGADADPPWPDVQPMRVVLDARLRTPLGSRLVTTARESPVVIFTAPDASTRRAAALEERGVELVRVDRDDRRGLDLTAVLAALAQCGVPDLLVEPGPTLAQALVESGLIDRWTAFLAPEWVRAPGARLLLPPDDGAPAPTLAAPAWTTHGPDAAVSGRTGDPGAGRDAPRRAGSLDS